MSVYVGKDLPSEERQYFFKYRNRTYGLATELWDYLNNKTKYKYSIFINVWSKNNPDNNIYLVRDFDDADETRFWFNCFLDILKTLDGIHIVMLLKQLNINFNNINIGFLGNDKMLEDIYNYYKSKKGAD